MHQWGDVAGNSSTRKWRSNCPIHSFISCISLLIITAITVHWIDDDWNLRQALLDFVEFRSPHTGKRMADLVFDTLQYYGLVDKLFCVTTDNASNNGTMAKFLSEGLRRLGVFWDHETRHVPCLAHIINLVVQAFLVSLNTDKGSLFKGTLDKIRELAKTSHTGTAKPNCYKHECVEKKLKPLKIPSDVAVRWNSTYRMLEAAIYVRPALERMCIEFDKDLNHLRLSETEWQMSQVILTMLMPFQRLTKRFECNAKNPEVDYVLFAYDTMFKHLDNVRALVDKSSADWAPSLSEALGTAIDKLNVYYDKTTEMPQIYVDAMILNPRVKFTYLSTLDVPWGYKTAEEYQRDTKERYEERYRPSREMEAVARTETPSQPVDTEASQDETCGEKRSSDIAFDTDDEEYREHLRKRAKHYAGGVRSEFDIYMYNPNGNPAIQNILHCWRDNGDSISSVRRMARDLLAVPASGCAVEREFSIAGRIVTWK
jgi:hAT family C-terminal dimerisation region